MWQIKNLGSSSSFPHYIYAQTPERNPAWEAPAVVVPPTPALTVPDTYRRPVDVPIAPYEPLVRFEGTDWGKLSVILGLGALAYLAFTKNPKVGGLSGTFPAGSKRLIYLHQEGRQKPKAVTGKEGRQMVKEGHTGTLYAIYAHSADEARELIKRGAARPAEQLASCDLGMCKMEDAPRMGDPGCADTKKRKVPSMTVSERRGLLEKYGIPAFLVPDGTPARPDVPAFPILTNDGCFSCSMGRAAYTRLGQGINNARNPGLYRVDLRTQRRKLINTALRHADENDKSNACNWAYAASKRYLSGISGEELDLFPTKRTLVLKAEDPASSADTLTVCLERRGWKPARVRQLQASISDKMTPDLFTGKTGKLTGGEVMLQEAIDKCLKRTRGIGDLSGEKLTCVRMQKVPSVHSEKGFVYRCAEFEPTEGAACVESGVPHPVSGLESVAFLEGQKMSCVSWQKSGRGWRCAEYSPTCAPKAAKKGLRLYWIWADTKGRKIVAQSDTDTEPPAKYFKLAAKYKGRLYHVLAHSESEAKRNLEQSLQKAKESPYAPGRPFSKEGKPGIYTVPGQNDIDEAAEFYIRTEAAPEAEKAKAPEKERKWPRLDALGLPYGLNAAEKKVLDIFQLDTMDTGMLTTRLGWPREKVQKTLNSMTDKGHLEHIPGEGYKPDLPWWKMNFSQFAHRVGNTSKYTAPHKLGIQTKGDTYIVLDPESGAEIKAPTPEEALHKAVIIKARKEGRRIPESAYELYPDIDPSRPPEEKQRILMPWEKWSSKRPPEVTGAESGEMPSGYKPYMIVIPRSRAPGEFDYHLVHGKPVFIKDNEEFELFIHRMPKARGSWRVSEGTTGYAISGKSSFKKDAIEAATGIFEKMGRGVVQGAIDEKARIDDFPHVQKRLEQEREKAARRSK